MVARAAESAAERAAETAATPHRWALETVRYLRGFPCCLFPCLLRCLLSIEAKVCPDTHPSKGARLLATPPCTSALTSENQDSVHLAPQRNNNVHVGMHPPRVTTHATKLSCHVYVGWHVVHTGGQATSVYSSHMADLYDIYTVNVSEFSKTH